MIKIGLLLLAIGMVAGSTNWANGQESRSLKSLQQVWPTNFKLDNSILLGAHQADFSLVCKNLWRNGNTNCNGVKLLVYDATTNAAIEKHIVKIRDELYKIYDVVVKTRRRMLAGQSGAVTESAQKISSEQAKVAVSTMFTNKELIDRFIGSIRVCWTFLKNARNVASCFICAKQHDQYFYKGKAVIKDSDCSQMMNSCGNFFKGSITYIVGALEILKTKDPENWRRSHIYQMNDLMDKAELNNLIATYFDTTTIPANKHKAMISICARVFSVHKKPFFQELAEMSSTLLHVEMANKLSNARRMLQVIPPEGNPFEGDVVVFSPSDNMFTSFHGNNGHSEHAPQNHHAMNLSMAFP